MNLEARVTRIEKHLGLKPYPQFTTPELISFIKRQQLESASMGRKLESITFKAENIHQLVPEFWTDIDSVSCIVVPNLEELIKILDVSISCRPSLPYDYEIFETSTRAGDWEDEDLL